MKGSFHIGEWWVEPQLNSLTHADRILHIEPKAMQVLVCLAENAGEVISKDRLIRAVWADTFVGDDVLTRAIAHLRKAFGDDAKEPRFIQTIPKSGYRLLVPVTNESVKQGTNLQAEAVISSPKISPKKWLRMQQVFLTCFIAVGMAITAFYAWTLSKPKQLETTTVKSIAVLPFKPLVADNRDEALEFGMAETVILKLGNLRDIIVRPLSSVRKFTALDRNPIAAGRELGVDAVLDPTIQTSGERVRMSARLLRVTDGATLWAYKCDEQHCANLFEMQDAIAEKITGALIPNLARDEIRLLSKHYTENRQAFELYLTGRFLWNKYTRDAMIKSIPYYQQAIDQDPKYALAYCGMADAYNSLGSWFGVPPEEAGAKAKGAALMALKLDETLAEAHASLGKAKFLYDWDWAGAEQEIKRAIELNPNSAEAHSAYGVCLTTTGRMEEAVAEARRGQELDPLSPFINSRFALRLYCARQYDEAIEQCRRMTEIDPNSFIGHRCLARIYLVKGMNDEAVAEFEAVDRLFGGNPELGVARKKAYQAGGIRGYLQSCLKQMKEQPFNPHLSLIFDTRAPLAIDFAEIYAYLGEKDQALESLQKAYEEHNNGLIHLKADPIYDSLRSDPRFTNLLRRMGLGS